MLLAVGGADTVGLTQLIRRNVMYTPPRPTPKKREYKELTNLTLLPFFSLPAER